jgi:hypothetical protein
MYTKMIRIAINILTTVDTNMTLIKLFLFLLETALCPRKYMSRLSRAKAAKLIHRTPVSAWKVGKLVIKNTKRAVNTVIPTKE